MFLDIITSFPVFIVEQFILKMDAREPIPVLLKRFNVRIPMINKIPYIGLKWAGVMIGVLTAMTYTGLLIWALLPPTKLAILPALNLIWSILLIIGIVMKKPMLLLPALGSSALAIAVVALFVIIDGFIFIVLVTVEWKFSNSEYLQGLVMSQVGAFDWKWALYDFYLLLCLAVFLAYLWVVIYSLLRSMRGTSEPNGMELDIKFKSAPVESVNAYPK
ncbi:uncharacterized protein LOC119077429 [Bradysia coprophila]|uniref:uncharacterized protein LOC119077429 n=1 Tax=Bradysia coprophila TaxID=38358 RepID=UPI00187DB4E9|nr:uncharacterized protein LOC119077429 [Bradysia coprophila]